MSTTPQEDHSAKVLEWLKAYDKPSWLMKLIEQGYTQAVWCFLNRAFSEVPAPAKPSQLPWRSVSDPPEDREEKIFLLSRNKEGNPDINRSCFRILGEHCTHWIPISELPLPPVEDEAEDREEFEKWFHETTGNSNFSRNDTGNYRETLAYFAHLGWRGAKQNQSK